jgi:hypothetical protein
MLGELRRDRCENDVGRVGAILERRCIGTGAAIARPPATKTPSASV